LNILDRLNERASTLQEKEVDLVLDYNIGIFFPYYAKRSRPQLFDSLMQKQNTDMNSTSAIPIFGLTRDALDFEIKNSSGQPIAVRHWITQHPDINKVEKTASSKDLGKFMLLVERDSKDEVEDFLDNLFEQFPENFQTGQFTRPQRGGNAFQKRRVNNITNYLTKLEEKVQSELQMYDKDSLLTSPPTRPRRMTISYAQAARRLSFRNEAKTTSDPKTNYSNKTMATSMSTLTQTSLDEAIAKIRAETEQSITALRKELKQNSKAWNKKLLTRLLRLSDHPHQWNRWTQTTPICTQHSRPTPQRPYKPSQRNMTHYTPRCLCSQNVS
jgi:hypothetical protein